MGLQIIRPDTRINFLKLRYAAFLLSGFLILVSIVSLVIKGGPQYGIDFSGGMIIQLKFDQQMEVGQVQQALQGTDLPGLAIQRFGTVQDNEFLVRTSTTDLSSDVVRRDLSARLEKNLPGVGHEIQRLEMVGPRVGADLRAQAMEALFYAVLLIAIYISGRFEKRWFPAVIMAAGLAGGIAALRWLGLPMELLVLAALVITVVLCWKLKLSYALGAVVALIHDVFITFGIFSLLNKELDLAIIAAFLTILGYSLNDTIVIYDRIRENIRDKVDMTLFSVINLSINQTLSRTILTSGTTLMVVLCLVLFGGGVIHDFALALFIGIAIGTFSSIFIASPILLGLTKISNMDLEAEAEPDQTLSTT
ncbi:preprotein translocase subunit SecF [Desulfonatronum thiosulfatophilum]|uniref:Protein-export membrane protein SecF n=1 Tax=Desulfonatronum thiosulfatophilum TaxID=617002 RepID=A0A1G6E902_9BACT|nr:protein translocase subunit SecF [Desulfonatronum thiosulfatophilum]SDB53929.1 preprotein translocase subunit SecF [Desulfonatronum thiosulfatophilum]